MPRKKITKSTGRGISLSASLKSDVYNLQGEIVGKTSLPKELFGVKASSQLLAQVVRVYQANERSGTHSTKTRSEVVGSTRKIYRQKGTGRARHGSITAPIFIGGGVAHGPHPKDYSLTLPQKMRQKALFGVLTDKLESNALKIVRGFEKIETKTKKMDETLINLKLGNEKDKKSDILLVTSQDLENVRLAGRNIAYLSIENAKLLNPYEVISHKNLLLMEEAVPILAGHFMQKGKPEETPRNIPVKQKAVSSPKKVSVKTKSTKKTIKNKNSI